MRLIIFICCLSLFSLTAFAQTNKPKYDKALADSLGADDYGMKSYVLVILKTGSNKIDKKEITDSLFRGHMSNMGRLVAENKLIVAGPLGKNEKEYRGIFILNVKTVAEANAILATDPAVKAKVLEAEVYSWYGSAALPVYLPVHDKIQKNSF